MNFRTKLFAIGGIVAFFLLVNTLPWERQSSGLTQLLYSWGEQQEENADEITNVAVSGVEGTLVGESAVDGSNWSIPNILRNLFSAH